MTIHLGTILLGAVILFAAWSLWALASGLLGITLGQLIVAGVIFGAGYMAGRGR
jgi:hypothetical protein